MHHCFTRPFLAYLSEAKDQFIGCAPLGLISFMEFSEGPVNLRSSFHANGHIHEGAYHMYMPSPAR